jgi:hypothetical protein
MQMNKCCVKNKECEHANSFGVCRLSSAYDCKPVDNKEYINWKKSILGEDNVNKDTEKR